MIATVNDVYMDVRYKLRDAGISAFDLEAKELISAACCVDRKDFHSILSKLISEDSLQTAMQFTERRLSGEPCAYIIGEWDFYGLTFTVKSGVLIPRPATEALPDLLLSLEIIKRPNVRILDLCSGTGCIGIALATHIPEANIVLADLSDTALQVCTQNVQKYKLQDRVTVKKCDALAKPSDEDMFNFDVIVSNPPYIRSDEIPLLDASVKDYEPLTALDGGADGLRFYEAIASNWKTSLTEGGMLIFESGFGQAEDVSEILRKNNFGRVEISKDLSGVDRVVCGTAINI